MDHHSSNRQVWYKNKRLTRKNLSDLLTVSLTRKLTRFRTYVCLKTDGNACTFLVQKDRFGVRALRHKTANRGCFMLRFEKHPHEHIYICSC